MEEEKTWEQKNITILCSGPSTPTSLSIQIASLEIGQLTPSSEKKNSSYVLTCPSPKTKVYTGGKKVQSVTVKWFVNGLEFEAEEDGSLLASFSHSGYRDITSIIIVMTEDGHRLLGEASTSLIQIP